MLKINIHEVKTHLSMYLEKLKNGETIIICKRNIPVAKIIPYLENSEEKRPIGLAKGDFEVPDDFFAPLPDDILNYFSGK